MDPIIKKRHRENKPLHSRKRQRADDEDDGLPNASGNGAVALDDLKWQAVDFPERFDNAEGFFGLEEISDVDVLRDFKLGKVEYKVYRASVWSLEGYSLSI